MSYAEKLHEHLNSIFGSPVSTFDFELNAQECSDYQISDFLVKNLKKKKKCSIDELLGSKKFRKIDCPLRMGVKYEAFLIPVNGNATYEESVLFMSMKNYLFLGPKVLTVIQDRLSSKLPKESWIYSIDLEENLVKDKETKYRRIPCVINYEDATEKNGSDKTRKEKSFEIAFAFTCMGFQKGDHLLCVRKVAD